MKRTTVTLASALLLGGLAFLGFNQLGGHARNDTSLSVSATEPGALPSTSDDPRPLDDPMQTEGSETAAGVDLDESMRKSVEEKPFDPASITSYAAIQESSGASFWRTSDGLYLRRKARGSCLFGYQRDMKLQEKNPDVFKNDQSRRLSNEYLAKFCRGVPVESSESIRADSELLPHTDDVYRASGLSELAQTDPDLAVQLALDLISRSKSGGAIEMAMDFLHQKNVNVGLGHENFSGGDAHRYLLRAQEIAAQMVSCDYSRLCGPDSLRAWVECVHPGVCQPGVSMQLIWQRSNSPQIYEGAVAIANQLRAMRRTP